MTDTTIWREVGAPLLPATGSGRLDGLSVAVKDLFAVEGFVIGGGNPAWLSQAPVELVDAWAVAALRAAGASIAGIAQTDELAYSLSGTNVHYGTPPNPLAPSLVTGGSSSGPASAVATRQADIGLGTDTAGSVRVPASVCGLYGLRPTHGVIPTTGLLNLAAAFDTVGWLTRDAVTLARVGEVLLPAGDELGPSRLISPVDTPEVRRLAEVLGASLTVGDLEARRDPDALLAAFRIAQAAQAWATHGDWITANPGALETEVQSRFDAGSQLTAVEVSAAREQLARWREQTMGALADRSWLVLPAAGGPGHARDASPVEKNDWRMATLRNTVPASAFGLPSVVIPRSAVRPDHEPPLGIALIAGPGRDRALLAAAVRTAEALLPS